MIKQILLSLYLFVAEKVTKVTERCLVPINAFLVKKYKNRLEKDSVLHISYLVHVPYHTVQLLKEGGVKAEYLAVGTSQHWNLCDYHFHLSRKQEIFRAFIEFVWFWKIVSRFSIIHSHFMVTMSKSGWEIPVLKALGRKIVVHYRGCEIRDRQKNQTLHPMVNICQSCDYRASICSGEQMVKRRELMQRHADLFLVTTPDLLDFAPEAVHMPFFQPPVPISVPEHTSWSNKRPLKVFHTTNHPGIEGTEEIQKVIQKLQDEGEAIDFTFLTGVSQEKVLQEQAKADVSIGKMKMGYYANAQIESLYLGIPAITYVRPQFVTEQLQESGLILSSLQELEKTFRYILQNPQFLAEKAKIAKNSIAKLHNNVQLVKRYQNLYQALIG